MVDQRGSQSLELVMTLPVVLLLIGMVVAVGQVGLLRIHAQQTAGLAAHIAAVDGDEAVVEAVARAGLRVDDIRPAAGSRTAGALVTVTLSREVPIAGGLLDGIRLTVSATSMTQPEGLSDGFPGADRGPR